jgi:DNA-binding MarR family transcriptional regulator
MTEKQIFFYEKQISGLISIMHREMVDKLNSMIPQEHINISHLIILEYLKEKGISNMSDLSRALKLTMGAATVIIDKMVALKLARRNRAEKDRRVVEVVLTVKGESVAAKFAEYRLSMIKDIFSVLTEGDKKAYLKLLEKICNGLRQR